MNPAVQNRQMRVFYRDYANDRAVPSSRPEWLPLERIAPMAGQVLIAPDNFFGVIDQNDVILQCYLADAPDTVTLELVYPEATGCLRLRLSIAAALECLTGLPSVFDESLLRGAQYVD